MPRGVYERKPKKKKEEKPKIEDQKTEFKKPVVGKSFGILRNRERNIKKYYNLE